MATNSGVDVIDLCFIRTAINFLTCLVTVSVSNQNVFDVPVEKRLPVLIRCVAGLGAFTCMVYSVQLLPIFMSNVIVNTAPFWTAIISYWLLGDQLTRTELVCMIGCFSGVVIMALAKTEPHLLVLHEAQESEGVFDISKLLSQAKEAH